MLDKEKSWGGGIMVTNMFAKECLAGKGPPLPLIGKGQKGKGKGIIFQLREDIVLSRPMKPLWWQRYVFLH